MRWGLRVIRRYLALAYGDRERSSGYPMFIRYIFVGYGKKHHSNFCSCKMVVGKRMQAMSCQIWIDIFQRDRSTVAVAYVNMYMYDLSISTHSTSARRPY